MDANADLPTSQVLPAGAADALANGDQRTPLETRRQMEVSSSPLQLEVVAQEDKNGHKDDKSDRDKEQEQRNTRQPLQADSDIEKIRLDFELTMLKRQLEENEKQRQHEEKMEHIRQCSPSKTGARGEEEPLSVKLDPITEIELEKMRMEFELAKLRHISEENERQRQHERKMYEEKEKQRQHEEKMEQMRQRQGNVRVVSQKFSTGSMAEAMTEASSGGSAEIGKVRIELQLAMEVYLPEMEDKKKKHPCEQKSLQESPKLEEQVESKPEAEKPQALPEQQNNGVTEHLGLQLPRIVVSGAEPKWSSSRLDLAIETELEKRRMEFELTRLKYEHEENERQRQHEEKMEQLRQQGVHPREEDNPENASFAADNVTEQTSAPDDLTEPPCTPNEVTDPLDIRDEEAHVRTKPRVGLDNLHPGLANSEGEVDGWAPTEQPNKKKGCDTLAPQLEKMRLDMELTMIRSRYEDMEKQRQHEEKMEEMRLQAPATQEDNPENASFAADNVTEQTSAPDDLTEPPCTPNEVTDPLDIRDEEAHVRTKPRVGLDNLHPGLANSEGEVDGWVPTEQPNKKEGCDTLAPQLEKMRLDMELTMIRSRYEDMEKQRQHEEKMEEMRLQAPATQPSGRSCHPLLPQDQFTLFLYCFIFIHVIYILRELVFFLLKAHEMFAIGFILICAIKTLWK